MTQQGEADRGEQRGADALEHPGAGRHADRPGERGDGEAERGQGEAEAEHPGAALTTYLLSSFVQGFVLQEQPPISATEAGAPAAWRGRHRIVRTSEPFA
ncbi:hypothetical protein [Streptomyces sp. 1331.2]|uniref:hypothetical protein n=1 Tax=Streptomyces sp. 1331.2 TaxID=1938835 RepID=UPI0015CF1977|nr:hypothetical protein [Streptomyces sp. 1331.2]